MPSPNALEDETTLKSASARLMSGVLIRSLARWLSTNSIYNIELILTSRVTLGMRGVKYTHTVPHQNALSRTGFTRRPCERP